MNNKSLIFCLSSSEKSWYEDLLDDGLKSTLTVCPSVLSNFKYWGTRPERQQIKDLLFILEKFNVSESAKRELTVFCDGLPRTYLVSSMPGRY
jgi:hypothetical protein